MTEQFDAVLAEAEGLALGCVLEVQLGVEHYTEILDRLAAAHAAALEAAERDARRLREILERIPTYELNSWLGGGMEGWLGATPTLDNFRAAIDACMGEKGNG